MPQATADTHPDDLQVVPFQGTGSAWDRAVDLSSESTFCHLIGWRHIIANELGHQVFNWVAIDKEGGIRGLLPLARVRSRLFGDYLISMPFVSYGGPVGSVGAKVVLVEKARDEAGRLGVDLLELRARKALPGGLTTSTRKLTVLKNLPDSGEELWEFGIRAKLRSQIRRPMKEGLEARFGSDLLEPFYDVFSRTMRDLGTPVLPKRFFRAIAEHFPSQVVFSVVMRDETPMAAGCGFAWHDEFEITWAGALREFSKVAPNMLLYWSLMEEAIRRGARTFNFGRCSADSSTHRFKQQWGTQDHPLPWGQWSRRGVAKTPGPEDAKFRAGPAIWRHLPLGVTRAIGPLISRSLP